MHGEYFQAMMLGMREKLCGDVGGGRKGKGEATEATVQPELEDVGWEMLTLDWALVFRVLATTAGPAGGRMRRAWI